MDFEAGASHTWRGLRYNGSPCVLLTVSAPLVGADFTKNSTMEFRYFKTACVSPTWLPQFKSLISPLKGVRRGHQVTRGLHLWSLSVAVAFAVLFIEESPMCYSHLQREGRKTKLGQGMRQESSVFLQTRDLTFIYLLIFFFFFTVL